MKQSSHTHKNGKQRHPPQHSLSPSSAKPGFEKHESLFFGVTPTLAQTEEAYEANRRAFYGVETAEGEGRGQGKWEEDVRTFFGVEGKDGQREDLKKRDFDPRIRQSADQRHISLPAGKRIPRDPTWKPSDNQSASALLPPILLPKSAAVPAGKKVPRDQPWKPEDEYSPEEMFPIGRKADTRKRQGNSPAGKIVEKDPIWSLSAGYPAESVYRKSIRFPAFRPSLQHPLQSADRTAGKRIPRDPAFSLIAGSRDEALSSRSQNHSALAQYGAETTERKSVVRASLGSRKGSRALTPEWDFAGAPSQRDLVDRSGHDPILNPIGAQLPGPLYRRPSRR